MAAPSVGRRYCAEQKKAAALISQSRRWLNRRVERATVQRLFFFAVARQIQFCLLLMRCVSLSLGKLSVVNRVIEGFVQFLARRIVADVDGLAVLFRHINTIFRNHILGGRDHGIGISLAVILGI